MPRRFSHAVSLAVLVTVTGATSAFAAAPIVGLTPLGGSHLPNITLSGINDSDVAVGTSTVASGYSHAFTYNYLTGGAPTDVGAAILPSLTLSAGTTDTTIYGSGINASGQIIGSLSDSTGSHGYITTGKTTVSLYTPGMYPTPSAVNAGGTVVGVAYTPTYSTLGFFYSGGATSTVSAVSGGTSSSLKGINDSGLAVGFSNTSTSGVNDLISYDTTGKTSAGGVPTDLGSLPNPGGTSSVYAYSPIVVNASGQIAGTSNFNGGSTGYAWINSGGKFTQLPAFVTGSSATVNAEDAAGDVVGYASNAAGNTVATLWVSGAAAPIDLNTLVAGTGWILGSATGINDNGLIIGSGSLNGVNEAFILDASSVIPSAVPEPMSLGLIVPGVMVILRRRRGC